MQEFFVKFALFSADFPDPEQNGQDNAADHDEKTEELQQHAEAAGRRIGHHAEQQQTEQGKAGCQCDKYFWADTHTIINHLVFDSK